MDNPFATVIEPERPRKKPGHKPGRPRKDPKIREPKPSKLKNRVRELLEETTLTMVEIAEACDVSVPWIARLKGPHGDAFNPAVDRMEELYEFLSGKELQL